MKKVTGLMIAIILFFSLGAEVVASADSLNSVHSEAVVNNDGTVDIEQTWEYDDSETDGTEHFINMNIGYGEEKASIGKESITDYEVYRNGDKMKLDENWDLDSSFQNKANKYGVIEVDSNKIELVFGITERTSNEFKIKYTAHNLIKETTDGSKYIHWEFLPTKLDPNPLNMTAEITTKDKVDINKVYGFKYNGEVGYVGDEKDRVYAEMHGNYSDDDTLNIFALFDDSNSITNTVSVDRTLEDKAKEMLNGSDYDLAHFNKDHFEPVDSIDESSSDFIPFRYIILILSIPAFIIFIITLSSSKSIQLVKNMDKDDVRKLKSDEDFYYRDKPDEVDSFVDVVEELIAKGSKENNLISYYISKWTSNGVFEYLKESEKGLIFKSETVLFKLHENKINKDNKFERVLFDCFNDLSKDGVISTGDLSKLNMTEITYAIEKLKENSYKELIDKGYVVNHGSNEGFIRTMKPRLTDNGIDLAFQHAGLRNYLSEFTLMNERDSRDIELWDYYFYMAALYGIADEFKKELKNIPNISEDSLDKYNMYYGNTSMAILISSINDSVNKAYTSHNSTSSSSGGGFGASGGGFGGGTR